MSSPITQSKDFQGCQAFNFRVHNITDVADLVASYRLDGALVYFAPNDDKHVAIWDDQAGALRKLAFVDELVDLSDLTDTYIPKSDAGGLEDSALREDDDTVFCAKPFQLEGDSGNTGGMNMGTSVFTINTTEPTINLQNATKSISFNDVDFLPNSGDINLGGDGAEFGTLWVNDLHPTRTITAPGTTGAQTINKASGSVNFAAAATSLVVTNSLVTAASIILATVGTNDATLRSVQAVAGSGSFTLYANAAATAETRVNFLVTN